jgi:hypothetical protein
MTLSIEQETVSVSGRTWQLSMAPASKAAFLEGTWDTLDELMQNGKMIKDVYGRLPYIGMNG